MKLKLFFAKVPWIVWLSFLAVGASTLVVVQFHRQSTGPISKDFAQVRRTLKPTGAPTDDKSVAGNALVEPAEPETKVAADAAGRVYAVHVKEGDKVTKGQLLVELESGTQKAELAATEADLAAAEAAYMRTARGMRSQDVLAIVSEAAAARSRSELAKADAERSEELARKGAISPAEADAQRRKYEAGRAESAAAGARANSARSGSRQEDVTIDAARLQGAKARRDAARASYDRFQVTAPTNGEILRVKVRVGEYFNPTLGDSVLIVGDTSHLRVRMDVDERDIARVTVGASAYVTATAFGDQKFVGKVTEVSKRMGRRAARADDPVDRVDVKVLEAVIDLEGNPPPPLVIGLRVIAHVGS